MLTLSTKVTRRKPIPRAVTPQGIVVAVAIKQSGIDLPLNRVFAANPGPILTPRVVAGWAPVFAGNSIFAVLYVFAPSTIALARSTYSSHSVPHSVLITLSCALARAMSPFNT